MSEDDKVIPIRRKEPKRELNIDLEGCLVRRSSAVEFGIGAGIAVAQLTGTPAALVEGSIDSWVLALTPVVESLRSIRGLRYEYLPPYPREEIMQRGGRGLVRGVIATAAGYFGTHGAVRWIAYALDKDLEPFIYTIF